MSTILFILNAAPYGSEHTYNGLRLAGALAKREDHKVRGFLMGDAASAAHRHQKVPQGYYNVEVMIGNVIRHGGMVAVCGTCMDARGIANEDLAGGCHRGALEELADWTELSDKVLVF
jgi:uncharacterized protein involved in oxidation of intracellular sulfur